MKPCALYVEEFVEGAEILKVLAHPVRLALIKVMLESGPTNVTSLYEGFEMPQSTISQHLAKLKQHRVISGTRNGLEIYYEVVDPRAQSMIEAFGAAAR
ncbi:ArsR/SmtB family transcription factor [Ectobacillus ponti]|uniref:Metalloregulator ArsR/SmtB family transcription factor n=1 Tax=Ectobacillus ponti TaxID=2961894 RepID=A0AA42BQZ9_9BACI|nr:metalloregulator ArsR/SmtB family transcription factor [Ectobacillus ponti]MCP8970795.1 metalloregulator ArsR/SmtB family transcription factor [Ectobacillus ponti]